MRVHQAEFVHPTQASRVRLNVYEFTGSPAPVYGMEALLEGGRFVVTEDRVGTATVVATLGNFPSREEALAAVERRVAELRAQRYEPDPPRRA